MEVFVVFHGIQYESNDVVGIFSDYVQAREFELGYIQKHNVSRDWEWTEIRKVEVNKVYDDVFQGIGVEV